MSTRQKLICILLILIFGSFCGPNQDDVDRTIEDGIEVIINHKNPYKIKGEPSSIRFDEEFTIDTENDEMAMLGLTDIYGFDVDSNGNIFLLSDPASKERHVVKFDHSGKFVVAFGSSGQGPGELQWPGIPRINNQDMVLISDEESQKLIFFDTNGNFIKQQQLKMDISDVFPLKNEKYLVIRRNRDPTRKTDPHLISLFSNDFGEIKILDTYIFDGSRLKKINGTRMYIFTVSISEKNIYIGNVERGYEIGVYDMEGNLKRIIRKEYDPVKTPEEHKKMFLSMIPERVKDQVYFSQYMPPFQYLFSTEAGYLFVMTYEKGENQNEYIYDIFNPDGCFIGRTSLNNFGLRQSISKKAALDAKATNERLYFIREKENAYKEFVVCKIIWESQ